MYVGLQVLQRLRAFFHAGHAGTGHKMADANAQAASSGAQVQHPGLRFSHLLQQLNGSFAHHLAVCAGAEHTGADFEGQPQKVPLPCQVLQRHPLHALSRQFRQALSLRPGKRVKQQARIFSSGNAQQFAGVVISIGAACGLQSILHHAHSLARQNARQLLWGKRRYHWPSSGFLGSTGVTAAMATSIMSSSGSKVVRCCSQSPGTETARASSELERPAHFKIS